MKIKKLRLSVFRSSKHIYAQIIDDYKGETLVSASDLEFKNPKKKDFVPVSLAYQTGELIGEKAIKKNIKKVVFDRGKYKYHGRVKAVAEGARSKGLIF